MNSGAREHPFQNLIRSLPDKPGVYQYLDKEGKVIYVGKAKNLKKRVASYFTKTHQSGKLKLLVRKISDIKFVVTSTELDALLLENNLIKKHQPRYNIQLKDDNPAVVSPAYLLAEPETLAHREEKIQSLPRISHRELQSTLCG